MDVMVVVLSHCDRSTSLSDSYSSYIIREDDHCSVRVERNEYRTEGLVECRDSHRLIGCTRISLIYREYGCICRELCPFEELGIDLCTETVVLVPLLVGDRRTAEETFLIMELSADVVFHSLVSTCDGKVVLLLETVAVEQGVVPVVVSIVVILTIVVCHHPWTLRILLHVIAAGFELCPVSVGVFECAVSVTCIIHFINSLGPVITACYEV